MRSIAEWYWKGLKRPCWTDGFSILVTIFLDLRGWKRIGVSPFVRWGSSGSLYSSEVQVADQPRPKLLDHVAPLSHGWEGWVEFTSCSRVSPHHPQGLKNGVVIREGHKCTANEIAQALCKEGDGGRWETLNFMGRVDTDGYWGSYQWPGFHSKSANLFTRFFFSADEISHWFCPLRRIHLYNRTMAAMIGEWSYESPGYRSWIGWLDTLGVLFLWPGVSLPRLPSGND